MIAGYAEDDAANQLREDPIFTQHLGTGVMSIESTWELKGNKNRVNPLIYLTYVFENLPNMEPKDVQALDKLLPWSSTIQLNKIMPT